MSPNGEYVSEALALSFLGSTCIVVQAGQVPSPEEWGEVMRRVEERLPQLRSVLVFTTGGGLKPSQREHVERVSRTAGLRVAVMTDSSFSRGVVTALSWFRVQIKAFEPADWDGACDHLRLVLPDRPHLREALEKLRGRMFRTDTGLR